ncbi:hypothetical protein KKE06_00400 [Candidatus Micrarchaeota archaeon]|nr:hypothetical protein [Candidatus Micrarchaeota archaeon]MBU1930755.1 hypothetical protein [Candidatus Micrarchaeota archaeon]
MVFHKAVEAYKTNFVTVLVFLLLGLFVFVFSFFGNMFASSGTVFLEYNLVSATALQIFVQLLIAIIYLAFFSLFLVVMIFAVRQHISKVRFATYLKEKVPHFTLELFEFFLVFSAISFFVGLALVSVGVPAVIGVLVLFLFACVLFFVPQSIVIDEVSWVKGVQQATHFFSTHFKVSAGILIIGFILIGIIPFIELFFDEFAFIGRFVSIIIVLVIFLPFIEILKTVAYLHKFELVKKA